MNKYLFSDIDGTINFEKPTLKINHVEVSSIKKWQDHQNYFILTTGNSMSNTVLFNEQIYKSEFAKYIITDTGARIIDVASKTILYEKTIPRDVSIQVLNFAYENNLAVNDGINKHIYLTMKPFKIFLANITFKWKKINDSRYGKFKRLDKLILNYDRPKTFKIDLRPERPEDKNKERLEKLKDLLEAKMPNKLEIIVQEGDSIQVTSKGISKGSAIKKICEINKWNIKDTIGIGDSGNDHSMLETVKLPISLENGEESVKRLAKVITSHVKNNGLSIWINKQLK